MRFSTYKHVHQLQKHVVVFQRKALFNNTLRIRQITLPGIKHKTRNPKHNIISSIFVVTLSTRVF